MGTTSGRSLGVGESGGKMARAHISARCRAADFTWPSACGTGGSKGSLARLASERIHKLLGHYGRILCPNPDSARRFAVERRRNHGGDAVGERLPPDFSEVAAVRVGHA